MVFASMVDAYREITSSPRLAQYVECYWTIEGRPGKPEHFVLPDGCVDILFSRRGDEPAALTVVGLMTVPLRQPVEPAQSYFGARFRPAMAALFIREAGRLNEVIQPLDDIWGSAARVLFEQLADARTPEAMARILDRLLRPLEPPDAGQRALRQLPGSELRLDRLASDAGLSARQFRRLCLDRAGVSPKYLTRILRFRKAVERIQMLKGVAQPSWAQFAVACCYYDQAHFIREFQEFAGCTPGRFLQYRRPANL
jgi:AraC-like DNA-binding protein